jgi:hypothetical protein
MPKGCIIYCIEKGTLEKYTILSIASVGRYGGFLSQYDIYCIQPRRDFPVTEYTIKQIRHFGGTFIEVPLNVTHRYYSFANKPLALSYMIDHYAYDQYIFLDGDTVVLNEPLQLLNQCSDFLLSPVYTKGIGIQNFDDTNGPYWSKILVKAGVKREVLPKVKTIIEGAEIIGYWNAGIIVVNGKKHVVEAWKQLTLNLLDERINPESGIFFVEQSALSAVLMASDCTIGNLPVNHNFPLTNEMLASEMYTSLGEICILHHLRQLELMERMPEAVVTKEKKLWIKEKMSAFKINVKGQSLFKTLPDSYRETVRILKERFYYFIYKFTSRKKR